MDTETSDLDIKGICISPPEVTLGFAYNFEQAESVQDFGFLKDYIPSELDHLYKNGYEGVIYDLRKFVRVTQISLRFYSVMMKISFCFIPLAFDSVKVESCFYPK